MLDLHLDNGDCFMTNGKNVGLLFGFKQPTEVDLHYLIEDNGFTLTTIPPVDEDDEMYVSDTGNYTLHEMARSAQSSLTKGTKMHPLKCT
jgi:hypothetical protein